MRGVIKCLIFSFATTLLISCSPNDMCLSNQHNLQAGIYSARAKEDKDSTLTSSTVYGLELEEDSLYRNESISYLYLPLSFSSNTTAFVIENNNLKDTIWFSHEKEEVYISRECGFAFNFTLDSMWHTKTFIDSVAIDYPYINYGEDIENAKIYIY
ncbi:DUF6452 family protein [Marinilabiliaceae bacterium ANBcel2]|nr:DUF6452 family protein [Marinilabiliaceae bacterium ANBcel2]